MAEKKKEKMKVNIFGWNVNFGWAFSSVVVIIGIVVWVLLNKCNIAYMNILFGGFGLLLLVALAYYWMDSRGYYNNLGRIRRTFYTMYIIFMIYGFISVEIDFADWKFLLQLSALVLFVDLAVFQNPNILKIWNTELKHDDEIREALNESRFVIQKNAKKVEKFTQIVQQTGAYFDGKLIPTNMNEYRDELTAYLELYSNVMDFTISFFMFEPPVDVDEKNRIIEEQIRDIRIRHAIDFEDREVMLKSFSEGETLILREGKLVAIPYFGDFYCMIVTIESKPELVDSVDAAHILSMLVVFDWYMTDAATDEAMSEGAEAGTTSIPTNESSPSNTSEENSETI